MESIWSATCSLPQFPQLRQDLDTDVLIIGGGLAGVLCAWQLEREGMDYVLLEAKTIGSGVSANTTAKLTVQHGLIYQKLGKKAPGYYHAHMEALEAYRRLCRKIPCDYQPAPSYVYTLDDLPKLEAEVRALEKLGAPVQLTADTELPFPVAGAIRLENMGRFHPLKFLRGVAQGLHIYEHSPVRQLLGNAAVTPHGQVRARRVVIATHFPILNKHGSYFIKMYQHRSYVLALENAPVLKGMYVDEATGGLSLRSWGELALLGGGSHRTGKPGGGWDVLRSFVREHYPQAREVAHWATQDCMSLDGIPYIGPYSAATTGLYVATGFHKWGMTGAMVAARLLTSQLQQRHLPWEKVFSPSRSMLKPQLAGNAVHALSGWLSPTVPRCPHLGCALKWNRQEHSWDCPCHGSRFDREGSLLQGPATGDLRQK